MTVSLTDTLGAGLPGNVLAHYRSFIVLGGKFPWREMIGDAQRVAGEKHTVQSQAAGIRKTKLLIPYLLFGVSESALGHCGLVPGPVTGWSQADERFVASASVSPLGRNEFDVVQLHVAVAVAGAVAGGAVAGDVDVPVPRVQGTA